MDCSDVDSDEDFHSADEYVDEDLEKSSLSVKNHDDNKQSVDDDTVVCDNSKAEETKSVDLGLLDDNGNEPTSYRKRPERPRRLESSVKKPLPAKKTDFKDVVDIVKVAKPETIIKDLKSHLTSNISRGFSKFQETSSSLKGLVLGSDSDDRNAERFVYDESRCLDSGSDTTNVKSALSEEIVKLSNAFARLNAENAQSAEYSGIEIRSLAQVSEFHNAPASQSKVFGGTEKSAGHAEIVDCLRNYDESSSIGEVDQSSVSRVKGVSDELENYSGFQTDAEEPINNRNTVTEEKSNLESVELLPPTNDSSIQYSNESCILTGNNENSCWEPFEDDTVEDVSLETTDDCNNEADKVQNEEVGSKDWGGDSEILITSKEKFEVICKDENTKILVSSSKDRNEEPNTALKGEPGLGTHTGNPVLDETIVDDAIKIESSNSLVTNRQISGGVEEIKCKKDENESKEIAEEACSKSGREFESCAEKGCSDWGEHGDGCITNTEIPVVEEAILKKMETTPIPEISHLEKLDDGWGEWGEGDEIEPVPVSAEKLVGVCAESSPDAAEGGWGDLEDFSTEEDKKEDLDGWGDWGEGDEMELGPVNNEKFVGLCAESSLDAAESGWGDFEDFHTEEVDDKKEDLDGWGDWGDDDDVDVSPSSLSNEDKKSAKLDSNPSRKEITNLTQEQRLEQDWQGWNSFGQKKDNEWGLGGWGFSSLINTATAVSSNLSAVTQGISTVIESGLGVPDPETMARIQQMERKKNLEETGLSSESFEVESTPSFPFRHIVSGVGKIVEVTKVQEIGSKVLSGGLNTLESIGKKTMEVLQEGDPGLKKKRAVLLGKGQALSQVLKEARDKSAAEDRRSGELAASRRCHLETVFDDFQGLIHLEALEMLSTQCQLRIEQLTQSLPSAKVRELQDTLEEVKQLCEFDEEFEPTDSHCFRENLLEAVEPVRNEFSIAKIIEVQDKITRWLCDENISNHSPAVVYDTVISAIAELTAAATQQFHKGGELLLLKERRKTVEEADSLLNLCGQLCAEISNICDRVSTILNNLDDASSALLLTNLQVESGNATNYIKQAFGLLLPVIQLGAV